jgi:autotransporter-associated beta strand protein
VSNEALTIAGDGGNYVGALQSASGSNTWAGPITLAANDTRIGANGSGQVLTVSGVISDGGNNYNLIVRNADTGGETILTGQNTYGGATRVLVGTLKIAGDDNRLPTASPLQIGNTSNVASALFDLNGYNQQVAGLVSEGTTMGMTVTNSSATAATLTINNTADRTYAGVISGNLALVKQGSAMQTLSGSSANTYTGTTTVQGGRLHLSKSSGVNAIGGNLVIDGGNVTFGANEQIPNTTSVTITSGTLNGTGVNMDHRHNHTETFQQLTMTGGVFQTGMGSTWTITGAASFTGGAGNTSFIGNSGAAISFGSLSLTGMNATAGNNLGAPNSFTLYGNSASARSTITVGSGGLTLNGSVINLRRGDSGALGSRLVLDGDVTTTGSSASLIKEDTVGGTTGQIGVELSSSAGTVTRSLNIGGGGADLTISIPISNGAATTAGITKTGPGTLILSAANTYTGTTEVLAGTLALAKSDSNNNISGSSAIRVGSGATLNVTGLAGSLLRLATGQTLQGNGTVQGNVEAPAGSFLAAGMSPGHLTITGNYTQAGTLLVELAGYQQGGTQALPGQWQTNGYDWVSVGGQAVLDGYLNIQLLAGFQPQSGDTFHVLTAAGGITDQGLDLLWQPGSLLPGQYWTYQILTVGQGPEQILQLQLGVPEPASGLLAGLALGALGLWLLRRRFGR